MRCVALLLVLLNAAASCWATEPIKPADSSATVSPAPPPEPIPPPEVCSLDAAKAIAKAAQVGYEFIATPIDGNSSCAIEQNGQILVVSASSQAEAKCHFELFVPPINKQQPILRLRLKATVDGTFKFIQRSTDLTLGLRTDLHAPKSQTRQFRLTHIELTPIEGQCEDKRLESRL